MGNYKFRLSDMMPNAWFYKLRDMSKKPRNQTQNPSQTLNQKITKKKKKKNSNSSNSSNYSSSSPSTTTTTTLSFKPNQPYQNSPRKSYYFTSNSPLNPSKPHSEDFHRKSLSKHRPRRRTSLAKHSKSCESSSEFTPESSPENEFSGEREFRCDGILSTKSDEVCSCKETDVVIGVDKASIADAVKPEQFESFAKLELPPIITKSSTKPKKKDHNNSNNSPGIRVRINHSPRIANRRVSALRKTAASSPAAKKNSRRSKSVSDSFAVVKSSSDPQRDFRESMMEMIVENEIRDSKDLEDLLACYLSLNSDEYHGMIIKVFKQIWFDLSDDIS